MADEKLFRKTPFNGYNRDDVLQYLFDHIALEDDNL